MTISPREDLDKVGVERDGRDQRVKPGLERLRHHRLKRVAADRKLDARHQRHVVVHAAGGDQHLTGGDAPPCWC